MEIYVIWFSQILSKDRDEQFNRAVLKSWSKKAYTFFCLCPTKSNFLLNNITVADIIFIISQVIR